MVLGEIFEEQADTAEGWHIHQVRIVDDGREHLAGAVEAPGFFDEALFAAEVGTVGFDVKGLAQDAEGRVVGVQRPVDDGSDDALGVVLAECVFDDALAGAGLADDDAEPALLAVDAQDIEDFPLVVRAVSVIARSRAGSVKAAGA